MATSKGRSCDTNISFQDIYDINGTGEYTLAAKIQYTGTDSQTYSAIFGGKEDNGGTEFFIGKKLRLVWI